MSEEPGQAGGPYPSPPNHVVGMRERHWKVVKYFDIEGVEPNEWEFYDLRSRAPAAAAEHAAAVDPAE